MPKIELPVVVTPSRIENANRCYRRHVLNDVLQKARYYSSSLEFGSVVHAGAAAHWRSNGDPAVIAKAVNDEWHTRFVANPRVDQDKVSLELALHMTATYMADATIAGPFTREGEWQVVSVEDRLEVPLVLSDGEKAKLSFQTDRVVWNKETEHLVIVDTKTGARLDKRWERQWDTSLQMKLYKAGAAKAYDFPASIVDVIVEGVLKDTPSKIVYVPCPDWSEGMLDEAVRQAVFIAERDRALITSADYGQLRNVSNIAADAVTKTQINYMSCFEYGVECPYRRLCTADPDDRVALLNAEYFDMPTEEY